MFHRHRIEDKLIDWKCCCVAAIAGLILNVGLTSADADLITYEYTATVFNANTGDGSPTSISPGASVSGFLTFESTAQDTNSSSTDGKYLDAVTDWEFTLTGTTFSGDDGHILVGNNASSDSFKFRKLYVDPFSSSNPVVDGQYHLSDVILDLQDTGDLDALSSDSLPTTLDLNDFTENLLSFHFVKGSSSAIEGDLSVIATVDSFQLREQSLNSTVPEPTSLALFGLGTVGFGALLRRRRKSVS